MAVRVESMCGIVELERPARSIVSLVPSISETLHYLGAEEQLVGITKFCEKPWSQFKSKERVGGVKNPDVEKIAHLKPDLILCNKEENEKDVVEELRELAPVHVSYVVNVDDAERLLTDLGALTGHDAEAQAMVARIEAARKVAPDLARKFVFRRVVHLVWKDPYMTVSPDTYIYSVLSEAGLEPVVPRIQRRYPQVDEGFFREFSPEAVLFPDEPYKFTYEDIDEFAAKFADLPCVAHDGLYKIEGAMTSWYGYRTTLAFEYLARVMRLE